MRSCEHDRLAHRLLAEVSAGKDIEPWPRFAFPLSPSPTIMPRASFQSSASFPPKRRLPPRSRTHAMQRGECNTCAHVKKTFPLLGCARNLRLLLSGSTRIRQRICQAASPSQPSRGPLPILDHPQFRSVGRLFARSAYSFYPGEVARKTSRAMRPQRGLSDFSDLGKRSAGVETRT